MFWLKHLETLPELSLSLFVLFTVSTTACFCQSSHGDQKKREKDEREGTGRPGQHLPLSSRAGSRRQVTVWTDANFLCLCLRFEIISVGHYLNPVFLC